MHPFVVEIYQKRPNAEVSKRRIGVDSVEFALKIMDAHSQYNDTTRVVIYRRISDGKLSKMKVWANPVL